MLNGSSRKDVTVDLGDERSYGVLFTDLTEISRLMRSLKPAGRRCLVVTDENVGPLYGNTVVTALESSNLSTDTITLPAGETTKSIEYLQHIYDSALSWGVQRDTLVVALGGGVVGDLGGFAAATLLRGLPLVQVPTTLVAQVDSSIGGKTGINHSAGKNLIGAFYQPLAVVCDTKTLQSLPERHWNSGLAEVIKHGLIDDESLIAFLESNWTKLASRDRDAVAELIPRAARVKARVVSEDEREADRRIILNFGHTFAHALESVTGYELLTHGEAVAAGMRAAIHLSKAIHPDLDARRADNLAANVPIPRGLDALSVDDLMEAMHADKKVHGGRLRLVLLRKLGEAYATSDVDPKDVKDAWRHIQEVAA